MNLKENIKKIIREEIEGLKWMVDTGSDFDLVINKAFYFDPIAESGDKDYTKLVNLLINLGFVSEYSTPEILRDERAVGVYAYRNEDGKLKYVYTSGLDDDDDEDYYEHIKDYAIEESEDYGSNLEVVDARKFIIDIGL